jgi:mono/diheme cytochrome c family protein
MKLRSYAVAAAILAGTTGVGAAQAQQVGDVAAGRKLAGEWCSSCHVVEPGATRGGTDSAPPFATLAADPRTTEFRLRAFLMTPHRNMPDFRLSRSETDDLVGYILSLRRP